MSNLDKNYLRDLFIEEAKAALSNNGSGNVRVPTKLSELENDIFGLARTVAASWTKDELLLMEDGDAPSYIGSAPFDISKVKSASDLGYSFTMTLGGYGGTVTETEAPVTKIDEVTDGTVTMTTYSIDLDDVTIQIMLGVAVDIENGDEIFGNYCTVGIASTNIALENFTTVDLTLYYKSGKKIPVDWVDTSDLEAAITDEITALKDEVDKL